MKFSIYKGRRSRGLTLADLAFLAAVFLVGFSALDSGMALLRDKVSTARLDADIRELNFSISLYRASGGRLDDVQTPLDVIARLQAAESSTLTYAVDNVVTGYNPVLQSRQEARSDSKRAVWNPNSQQFEISRGGEIGIKAFDNFQAH